MGEALEYIKCMFGLGNIPLVSTEYIYYFKSYAVPMIIGLVGSTPVVKNMVNKLLEKETAQRVINIAEPVILVVLTVTVTAFLVDGSFNPFLYFRF
jgi:alginate O-acetyltransferase complex protein AlgI